MIIAIEIALIEIVSSSTPLKFAKFIRVMVMVMACVIRDYDFLWRLPVITKGETKNDCIQQKTRFLIITTDSHDKTRPY
jgi:hypothetical protein